MNTPISWLKAYVPELDVEIKDFVDAMTLSGSHVENYEKKDKNLEKIVVGKIEKIESLLAGISNDDSMLKTSGR